MSNNVECEILADDSIASTRAGESQNRAPVAQTGSVIQQMSNRERRTVVGEFGNIFLDRIVDAELAVLLEQYERRGGELLRDRT